jgi:drug/metabolite transporter (DMT)-like permease
VKRPSSLGGITLALTSLACFAALDTTTKFITLSVPVLVALWCRYLFQVVATTAIMLPLRGRALLHTRHPKFQALRAVLLLSCSGLAMISLKHLPVAEFTAIVMLTPLVITLLAATRLGEKVSPLRWALVAGGFVGTLIIIRPDSHVFGWSMLLPLILVGTNAWYQVLTSQMAQTEEAATMHFYTGWIGLLLVTLTLPWVWVTPQTLSQWSGLLLMGFLGTVGHLLLIQAYAKAPASTLTPFLYAQIGFAGVGGWLMFSHVPDAWSLIGIGMIALCGAAGAWLAVREGRPPFEPPQT